jgi:hypothetical protein
MCLFLGMQIGEQQRLIAYEIDEAWHASGMDGYLLDRVPMEQG